MWDGPRAAQVALHGETTHGQGEAGPPREERRERGMACAMPQEDEGGGRPLLCGGVRLHEAPLGPARNPITISLLLLLGLLGFECPFWPPRTDLWIY